MGLCAVPLLASAAEPLPQDAFAWRAPVRGAVTNGGLYRVKVPGHVLDGSRAFPADLRIFDRAGNEWPFYVWKSRAERNGRAAPPDGTNGAGTAARALAPMDVPREDLKSGVQTLVLDVGHRNVPVIRLRLETADAEFACPLKVYGRNMATNSWRWVADGGIHRLDGQVRDAVEIRDATYRYLKVELYHYEQPPPAVTNVLAEFREIVLVTEALSGLRAHAYVGAAAVSLPRYDLQRRTSDEEVLAAPWAEFGPRERNPTRLARTLQAYGRWLGAMALAVMGILGAFVALKWMRHRAAG